MMEKDIDLSHCLLGAHFSSCFILSSMSLAQHLLSTVLFAGRARKEVGIHVIMVYCY